MQCSCRVGCPLLCQRLGSNQLQLPVQLCTTTPCQLSAVSCYATKRATNNTYTMQPRPYAKHPCNIATSAACNYTNAATTFPTSEASRSGVGVSQQSPPPLHLLASSKLADRGRLTLRLSWHYRRQQYPNSRATARSVSWQHSNYATTS